MNKLNNVLLLISLFLAFSCSKDSGSTTLVGNWVQKSELDGPARRDAVAFTIGDRAFIGTGYDGTDRLRDFWEYDPVKDSWKQKASLPDSLPLPATTDTAIINKRNGADSIFVSARSGAVAFSTDTKGYIGTGFDGVNELKDFLEYDPESNTWKQIADFGSTARYSAVAFSIHNIGYVCSGWDGSYMKDLWAFYPGTDTGKWVAKESYGGLKRMDAAAFVIGDTAYVCTGINNGAYVTDFYAYNPSLDAWTKKRDIANVSSANYDDNYNIKRIRAIGFAANGKGYIATGSSSSVLATVWEYDPTTDLWTAKTNFEGTARADAVSFVVNNVGYIATGANSSYYLDDIWAFYPDATYNVNDK